MKKGLIKIIVIVTSMIIMVSYLNKTSEDKIYYKNISGDINELGDLNLVYNYNKNLYYTLSMLLGYEENIIYDNSYVEYTRNIYSFTNYMNIFSNSISAVYNGNTKKQTFINRDEINTKILTQQEIDDNYKKYTERLDYNESVFDIFEDENHKGYARMLSNEDENYKYILVNTLDKKENKKREIKIPLGKEFNRISGDDYIQIYYNFMYNGEIYSMISNDTLESDKYTYMISILKLDLNNKSYKNIKDIKLENEEHLTGFKFLNDNKVYIEAKKLNEYDKCFYVYDIKENSINKSQIIKNYESIYSDYRSNPYMVGYKAEDNKLTQLIKAKDKYIYELTYSLSDFSLVNSKRLNFKVNDYSRSDRGNSRLFYINNKLISISHKPFESIRNLKNGKRYSVKSHKPIEIQVFDIKKNKIVYEGELLSSKINSFENLYYIKNNN